MIHLVLKREPHWLDLGHGVRVHGRPCTTVLITAALVRALGRVGIQVWEGVGDGDGAPTQSGTSVAGPDTAATAPR